MHSRRGRYLKAREEIVYIIRKNEQGDRNILWDYNNAIVSNRDPILQDDDIVIPFYINFNSVIDDIRDGDIVVRKNSLRDGQKPLDYDETNAPLKVISVEKRQKRSQLLCLKKTPKE